MRFRVTFNETNAGGPTATQEVEVEAASFTINEGRNQLFLVDAEGGTIAAFSQWFSVYPVTD